MLFHFRLYVSLNIFYSEKKKKSISLFDGQIVYVTSFDAQKPYNLQTLNLAL